MKPVQTSWRLVISGCGTSHGNPPWGIPELWSEDRRDQRRRSGALLIGPAGQVLLIDCGPDLMQQMRDPWADWDGRSYPQRCISRCDGLLLTHDHADHSHGINDLRHLNRLMRGQDLPIYGHSQHLDELQRMFPYCFGERQASYHAGNPSLRSVPKKIAEPFEAAGLQVCPWPVYHGPAGLVLAWQLGQRCAYVTDAKTLPTETRAALRGMDLLVLNMLQEEPHETHLNWQECQDLLQDLRPVRAVLTHLGYTLRWRDWQERLPAGVEMAYDGWEASFDAA